MAAATLVALILPAAGAGSAAAHASSTRIATRAEGSSAPASARAPLNHLDRRCLTGQVICIDKTTRLLRFVRDGEVVLTMSARFGSPGQRTREGLFHVYWKDRHHVSQRYPGLPMPYSLFFSGGEAVHYSPDFARNGYLHHSHGCVETRDLAATAELYALAREGDKVVVYRGASQF